MSKVLVFCIDALCASDVARMRRMPHFAQILERGALVEKIEPGAPGPDLHLPYLDPDRHLCRAAWDRAQ